MKNLMSAERDNSFSKRILGYFMDRGQIPTMEKTVHDFCEKGAWPGDDEKVKSSYVYVLNEIKKNIEGELNSISRRIG